MRDGPRPIYHTGQGLETGQLRETVSGGTVVAELQVRAHSATARPSPSTKFCRKLPAAHGRVRRRRKHLPERPSRSSRDVPPHYVARVRGLRKSTEASNYSVQFHMQSSEECPNVHNY